MPKNDLLKEIELRKKEVRRILEGASLRDKFSHLLPDEMRLKIGYLHYKLINKMSCIDRCIIYNIDWRQLSLMRVERDPRDRKWMQAP